jgi:Flp pilus assembly protein TadD
VRNGKPDRTLVALYHNLGVILAMQGRDAEAEAAYGSSLAASETVLGKDHPDSASILAHLIYSLRAQRKDEQVRAAEMSRLRIQLATVGEAIRESPTKSGLHRCHGILLCRAGRFDEAVPDFDKAIELDPEDHWYWFYRGCVLACTGNSEAYRAHCAAMLRQFGGTTDRNIADRTAKTCLLRPDATPDLAGQLRLVDVALAPGGNEDELPWFLLLKGLAEYRQGHDGAAVDWLERSRRSFAGADAPRATVTLLLAMAHRRLGHAEQARGLFDEARGIVERDMPKATVDDLSGDGIENWLICHVIRREAEALFADG